LSAFELFSFLEAKETHAIAAGWMHASQLSDIVENGLSQRVTQAEALHTLLTLRPDILGDNHNRFWASAMRQSDLGLSAGALVLATQPVYAPTPVDAKRVLKSLDSDYFSRYAEGFERAGVMSRPDFLAYFERAAM
jgi:hypothetical protein